MENPYDSPVPHTHDPVSRSAWYEIFYRLCRPAWYIGSAIIVLSWLDVVTPTIGWTGFAIACAASLLSYALPKRDGSQLENYFPLDTRLLKIRDDAYHYAMEQFATGATLAFDGVDFQLRPNNEIECEITATTHELDDHGAHELTEHTKSVFDQLNSSSPEFARAVANRSLSVSILSWSGQSTIQLCRVVDGKLQWQR